MAEGQRRPYLRTGAGFHMLSEDCRRAASTLLWDAWRDGCRIDALPEELRPASRADGYAVQALLEERSREPLFGWKIAATSEAGQRHINVDGPLAGRLLAENVRETGAEIPLGGVLMRVAEAEFAFRMGRDLEPREAPYTVTEALQAVEALHPSIEIPDSRYSAFTEVGAPQLIADNSCAHLFVLGPPAPASWRDLDLREYRMIGSVAGTSAAVEREGRGDNVLGDPRVALAWLVNELSGLGITLRAGAVVTTGTCLVPLPIAPGDEVTADFGPLGTVSARIV